MVLDPRGGWYTVRFAFGHDLLISCIYYRPIERYQRRARSDILTLRLATSVLCQAQGSGRPLAGARLLVKDAACHSGALACVGWAARLSWRWLCLDGTQLELCHLLRRIPLPSVDLFFVLTGVRAGASAAETSVLFPRCRRSGRCKILLFWSGWCRLVPMRQSCTRLDFQSSPACTPSHLSFAQLLAYRSLTLSY